MSNQALSNNFAKPVPSPDDGYPTLPNVEFTEDRWNTIYRGKCIDSTFDSYLVDGDDYGIFWIPKCYVRLASS